MQTVSSSFHHKSQSGIRKHRWSVLMSFDKSFDDSKTFFVLDSSTLDGADTLSPVDNNPIQYWDFYEYATYTDRVMSIDYSRGIDFPFSVQSSSSSVVMNNFDNYFSSHTNSPIASYLIPQRPIKILTGYQNEPLLQQFVGLTQGKPQLDQSARTAKFDSSDYLSELFKLKLSESIALSNVRTDEALAALFQQFGIASYQYDLARGRNTIPFLFLEEGKNAGECFRDIMQAEGGQLWIDEQGIIRFSQRLSDASGPVFTFNDSNIVSIETTGDTEIINRVRVTSNIREIQSLQPIHAGSGQLSSTTLSEPVLIPANGTGTYIIKLDDPLSSYNEPTLGVVLGNSWFTASTSGGTNVSSNITVSGSVLAINQLSLTLSNTNAFDVYMDAIEVYGQPAKIVDTIIYEAFDQNSIDEYGDHLLDVKNDMFGSESNCESFAYTIIDAYSEFDSIVEMSVKGNPALQLNDIIWIDTTKVQGQFKITNMSNAIGNQVSQIIRASRYRPRYWFVLDSSGLDGTDVLAP